MFLRYGKQWRVLPLLLLFKLNFDWTFLDLLTFLIEWVGTFGYLQVLINLISEWSRGDLFRFKGIKLILEWRRLLHNLTVGVFLFIATWIQSWLHCVHENIVLIWAAWCLANLFFSELVFLFLFSWGGGLLRCLLLLLLTLWLFNLGSKNHLRWCCEEQIVKLSYFTSKNFGYSKRISKTRLVISPLVSPTCGLYHALHLQAASLWWNPASDSFSRDWSYKRVMVTFQEQTTQHPFYLLPDNLLVAPLALGDDIRIWQDRFQGNLITSLLNLLFKS